MGKKSKLNYEKVKTVFENAGYTLIDKEYDEKALENFEKQKINDDIKNKYCKDKNIKLLRVSYKSMQGSNTEYKELLNKFIYG